MPFGSNNEDEEDDLYDSVVAMADRMKLQGKERQAYIHDHMLQGGYEPVQSREAYARVQKQEDEGGQGGGTRSWFGSSSGTRRSGGRSRDEDDRY